MASHEELRESIDHLRGELESGEPLAADDRAALERILAEVVALLEREGTPDDDESLADQLRDSTNDFESSHPSLTYAVGLVADALSRLGI
jgi:hypothetical protein